MGPKRIKINYDKYKVTNKSYTVTATSLDHIEVYNIGDKVICYGKLDDLEHWNCFKAK